MKKNTELKIVNIAIDKILPNPNQPRKHFNEATIKELSQSILKYGVLQPIQVRRLNDDYYELVSGERRLRGSKMAGEQTIPAIIMSMNDEDSAIVALIENVQREDLSFFEEAGSYKQLTEYYNLTQENIAQMVGKTQSFVANKMRLLRLPTAVVEVVREKGLSERHARALLKIPDEELQMEVLKQVVAKDLTVSSTEHLVEKVRDEVLVNNYDEKITRDKKARVKTYINAQIYINTIKTAFKAVKDSKKNAEYKEIDAEDHVEIRIIIPK